jgi:phosphoenolpyruvate carboxylase
VLVIDDMTSRYTKIKELLGKPYSDLEFLLQCLATVLEENGEMDLAMQIPWLKGNTPDFSGSDKHKVLRLYSIAFQLLNLSEVNGAVQSRRRKQDEQGLDSVNGLWGRVFTDLKKQGVEA